MAPSPAVVRLATASQGAVFQSRIRGSGTYLPALDGLRGIAVLLVMFHHFWIFSGAPGPERGTEPLPALFGLLGRVLGSGANSGWIGVDLFFVLSGFLITGILLDTKGQPGCYRTFYIRRTLRIFPLYFGFLALLVTLPHLVLPGVPGARERITETAAWYWTYTSNVLIARDGWDAVPLPIGHLWSLAIEEQFYLIWPMVVFSVSSGALKRVCLGIIAGSLVLRCLSAAAGIAPVSVYVFTLTRWDTLAAGALVALSARHPDLRVHRAWVATLGAGAAIVLGAAVARDRSLDYESVVMQTAGFSALAFVFAAAVAWASRAARDGAGAGRLLHLPLLRWLGRRSYGLYLFHVPVIFALVWWGLGPSVFPRVLGSGLPGKLLVVAVAAATSIVLALLSWELFERRFLALKERFAYAPAHAVPLARITPGCAAEEPQAP